MKASAIFSSVVLIYSFHALQVPEQQEPLCMQGSYCGSRAAGTTVYARFVQQPQSSRNRCVCKVLTAAPEQHQPLCMQGSYCSSRAASTSVYARFVLQPQSSINRCVCKVRIHNMTKTINFGVAGPASVGSVLGCGLD